MMNMLVAVIPAFNEEDSIGSVLEGVKKYVDHIIVVDDGSSDRTAEVARAAGVHTLVHPINRGQGAALQTGHEYARALGADYVVHFDADGQFNPEEIPLALKALQSAQVDILFGSRYLNKKSELPFTKKYILHPASRFVNFLFGTPNMSDAHNGFRVLTKKAFHTIDIQQDRMAHATEIPAQVKEHGLQYVEFPVTVQYFEYGQNIKGGFRILKDLIMGQFIR